jgi:hypothetical protein
MNHLRLFNHYAPEVRNWKANVYIETGFDRTAHKVDVRRVSSVTPTEQGRYNIQNIGIFLWSLDAWSITNPPQRPPPPTPPGQPECFRFSSLGRDIPLFHKALSQGSGITDSASEPPKAHAPLSCSKTKSSSPEPPQHSRTHRPPHRGLASH